VARKRTFHRKTLTSKNKGAGRSKCWHEKIQDQAAAQARELRGGSVGTIKRVSGLPRRETSWGHLGSGPKKSVRWEKKAIRARAKRARKSGKLSCYKKRREMCQKLN